MDYIVSLIDEYTGVQISRIANILSEEFVLDYDTFMINGGSANECYALVQHNEEYYDYLLCTNCKCFLERVRLIGSEDKIIKYYSRNRGSFLQGNYRPHGRGCDRLYTFVEKIVKDINYTEYYFCSNECAKSI